MLHACAALPVGAAEFVRLKVNVIVTHGAAPHAASKVTSVVPIVLAANSDPVGSGLVASLARPGRNVTGLSVQSPDLAGKRIEILRDAVPGLRHVGILVSARSMIEAHEVQAAARILGLETPTIEVEHAEEIAPAVNALPLNVRYQGQPRHSADGAECPRMTRVGHRVGQNLAL